MRGCGYRKYPAQIDVAIDTAAPTYNRDTNKSSAVFCDKNVKSAVCLNTVNTCLISRLSIEIVAGDISGESSFNKGVYITVSDSGIGIPMDKLSHIFDRFYRVDRSRTRRTGGSGLGLAIVKQLVESQGGQVWVDSIVGRGSTFSFSLPLSYNLF